MLNGGDINMIKNIKKMREVVTVRFWVNVDT